VNKNSLLVWVMLGRQAVTQQYCTCFCWVTLC